jgi:hypothetical protein
MKLFSKIPLIIFASLLTSALVGCSSVATISPLTISSPSSTPTPQENIKTLLPIKLPPQFKSLTTTNQIFINGTSISLKEGDYGKELSEKDLEKIKPAPKYVLTFSENEKWVKLKDAEEDITRTGIVKKMTVTKPFLKEAEKSLQDFLKNDNYYNLHLWNPIVKPSIFKKESSTTDPNARYYVEYVSIAGPPKKKLDALKVTAQPLSKNDQAIIMVISPIEDTKLRFNYKFTDTVNAQVYTTTTGVEVSLKFSKIIPDKNPRNSPSFEWELERVIQ